MASAWPVDFKDNNLKCTSFRLTSVNVPRDHRPEKTDD
jgi:hypothetical protein